MVSDY
jgi:hypothetical protein